MATAAQKRMIWGIARKLHMNDGDLHSLAAGLTGCESIRQLNIQQAARVIDRLNALAGRDREVPDRATKRQQARILAGARALGWAEEPRRLRGFLEKRWGVSDVRFLTLRQAGQVIEAMKAMEKGGRSERRERGRRDE